MRDLARCSLSALRLDVHPESCHVSPRLTLALLVIHVAGLAAIARLTRQPLWLGLFVALLVLPILTSGLARKIVLLPQTLTPLLFAYALAILRFAVAAVARPSTSIALEVPEPWATWLDLNLALSVCSVWALLAQLDAVARAIGRAITWRLSLGSVIAGLTLCWAVSAYTSKRTHGATASDPFAYVQMAVDLALRGTPLHFVRLTSLAEALGLSLWPLVPVGYGPSDPTTSLAASAWPPGYSALLAVAYRLAGESAVYWTTPLLGVATLLATWWLVLEVLHRDETWRRRLSAGLAVLVLATSIEQVDRTVVTMADIPAQLFTVLAVTCALRAVRGPHVSFSVVSGLCLGLAFDIRYTQVLVAACVLVVWLQPRAISGRPRGAQWRGLVVTALAAVVSVVPLFWYHAVAFGSPLSVESAELQLFAAENVWYTLLGTLGEVLRPNEFLYLLPFGVLGGWYLWRTARWQWLVLATWVVILVGFHLPYAALRIRDLLSVFPVLALLVGVGMSAAFGWANRAAMVVRHRAVLAVAGLFLASMWLRSVPTLAALGLGATYSGFGYLLPEQRAAFDTLADLTPPDALVASTLNSGPVMLYAGRKSVRPGAWTTSEWRSLVAHVIDHGGRVFILDDGEELARPRADLQAEYALEPRAELFLPYFSLDAGSVNQQVVLYEVVR